MDTSPDIAAVAAMIGDPARSRMLLALMGGRALTATELSLEADVSPSTASAHLAKLRESGLIRLHRQGRHRYFQIADETVAELIEQLCGVAARTATEGSRVTTGPKDPTLRKARVCYDHLAGELGVRLFDSLVQHGHLTLGREGIEVTAGGQEFFAGLDIDVAALARLRRPLCRQCLDWSVRRFHLAGALGTAVLEMLFERRWAERDLTTRAVHFSAFGEKRFLELFPVNGTDLQRVG